MPNSSAVGFPWSQRTKIERAEKPATPRETTITVFSDLHCTAWIGKQDEFVASWSCARPMYGGANCHPLELHRCSMTVRVCAFFFLGHVHCLTVSHKTTKACVHVSIVRQLTAAAPTRRMPSGRGAGGMVDMMTIIWLVDNNRVLVAGSLT